jgi:glucose 1-dehydrogenase
MLKSGGVALITDASHKVAEAIAVRLEAHGVTVIKNYPEGRIEGQGSSDDNSFTFNTCSLSQMKELLNRILQKVEGIHFLIHSDNVVFTSAIEEISEENFKNILDRNAKSAFITTKVFGEHMADRGQGAIVYLSTLHDEKPTGCTFTYSVGKGAVKMLCKEIALFYGRKGIRANLIEMDCIDEDEALFDSFISPFHYDAASRIPQRRLAVPEDFVDAVIFLLSDEAKFINGAELRIDGGHLLCYSDREK